MKSPIIYSNRITSLVTPDKAMTITDQSPKQAYTSHRIQPATDEKAKRSNLRGDVHSMQHHYSNYVKKTRNRKNKLLLPVQQSQESLRDHASTIEKLRLDNSQIIIRKHYQRPPAANEQINKSYISTESKGDNSIWMKDRPTTSNPKKYQMKYKLNDLVPVENSPALEKSPMRNRRESIDKQSDFLRKDSIQKMIMKFKQTGKFSTQEKIHYDSNSSVESVKEKKRITSPSKTFYNSRVFNNYSGSKAINDLEISIRDSYALTTSNGKFQNLTHIQNPVSSSSHQKQRSFSQDQIDQFLRNNTIADSDAKTSTQKSPLLLNESFKLDRKEQVVLNMTKEYQKHKQVVNNLTNLSNLKLDWDIAFYKIFTEALQRKDAYQVADDGKIYKADDVFTGQENIFNSSLSRILEKNQKFSMDDLGKLEFEKHIDQDIQLDLNDQEIQLFSSIRQMYHQESLKKSQTTSTKKQIIKDLEQMQRVYKSLLTYSMDKFGLLMTTLLENFWKVIVMKFDQLITWSNNLAERKVRKALLHVFFDKKTSDYQIVQLTKEVKDLHIAYQKLLGEAQDETHKAQTEKIEVQNVLMDQERLIQDLTEFKKRDKVLVEIKESYRDIQQLMTESEMRKEEQIESLGSLIGMLDLGSKKRTKQEVEIQTDTNLIQQSQYFNLSKLGESPSLDHPHPFGRYFASMNTEPILKQIRQIESKLQMPDIEYIKLCEDQIQGKLKRDLIEQKSSKNLNSQSHNESVSLPEHILQSMIETSDSNVNCLTNLLRITQNAKRMRDEGHWYGDYISQLAKVAERDKQMPDYALDYFLNKKMVYDRQFVEVTSKNQSSRRASLLSDQSDTCLLTNVISLKNLFQFFKDQFKDVSIPRSLSKQNKEMQAGILFNLWKQNYEAEKLYITQMQVLNSIITQLSEVPFSFNHVKLPQGTTIDKMNSLMETTYTSEFFLKLTFIFLIIIQQQDIFSKNLSSIFDLHDNDKKGTLTKEQFTEIMTDQAEFIISDEVTKIIFMFLDPIKEQEIEYSTFCHFLNQGQLKDLTKSLMVSHLTFYKLLMDEIPRQIERRVNDYVGPKFVETLKESSSNIISNPKTLDFYQKFLYSLCPQMDRHTEHFPHFLMQLKYYQMTDILLEKDSDKLTRSNVDWDKVLELGVEIGVNLKLNKDKQIEILIA